MPVHREFITIVDDDPDTLKSLTRLLTATGYRAEAFGSAQEFLGSVGTSRAACLLFDIGLGAQSGLELARHAAVRSLGLPLILMSGGEDDEVHRQALAAGASAFLRKPFRSAELLDALARALQNAVSQRRAARAHPVWTAAPPTALSSTARIIRKRSNRRLLDIARNRYVNLADLRTMVAQHIPLVVLDKNGTDITRATLLQAVIEQEQGEHAVLNCSVLKQMICCSNGPRAGSLGSHLEESVRRWARTQDQTID